MKKAVLLALIVFGLAACDNHVKLEVKTDSLKHSLDTSLTTLKDSIKEKGQRILDATKVKIEVVKQKNDSAK